jgi:hypothetical protein
VTNRRFADPASRRGGHGPPLPQPALGCLRLSDQGGEGWTSPFHRIHRPGKGRPVRSWAERSPCCLSDLQPRSGSTWAGVCCVGCPIRPGKERCRPRACWAGPIPPRPAFVPLDASRAACKNRLNRATEQASSDLKWTEAPGSLFPPRNRHKPGGCRPERRRGSRNSHSPVPVARRCRRERTAGTSPSPRRRRPSRGRSRNHPLHTRPGLLR